MQSLSVFFNANHFYMYAQGMNVLHQQFQGSYFDLVFNMYSYVFIAIRLVFCLEIQLLENFKIFISNLMFTICQ